MKKIFITIAATLSFNALFAQVSGGAYNYAQATGNVYNNGVVYTPDQYTEIEGTPYLEDKWVNGSVFTNNHEQYNLLKINLDLLKNKFLYNQNDTLFEMPVEVNKVVLNTGKDTMIFENGFQNIPNNNREHFFQVLAEGKLTLLKDMYKKIEDEYEYNNANKKQSFKLIEYYYIISPSGVKQISLSEKEMKQLLNDKWAQVQSYIQQNKLSAKKENDWKKIIGYYNSI